MVSKRINRKTKRIDVRVPIDLVNEIDLIKDAQQSYSSFVIMSLKNEIERIKKDKLVDSKIKQ